MEPSDPVPSGDSADLTTATTAGPSGMSGDAPGPAAPVPARAPGSAAAPDSAPGSAPRSTSAPAAVSTPVSAPVSAPVPVPALASALAGDAAGPGEEAMALVARAGIDGRRLRNALVALADGRWWTLADLVRETATSRRTIEELLREVDGRLERSGARFRLPATPASPTTPATPAPRTGPSGPPAPPEPSDLPAPTGTAARPTRTGPRRAPGTPGMRPGAVAPADPVAHLLTDHGDLVALMDELIAKAPRGRHTLDHVAATGETVVRRALLLDTRFWLDGARLLCVGDHDLTSLATALLHPGVEVTVADIDERILAYIAEQAARLDLAVRTRWADLRLGLPASAHAWADLAITDPPYSPEGVALFVARGAEGLRDRERGRILLAYGASERTPALALKVQQALSGLNLVSEAIYPDFNRYLGAEAIGSAADLYVLRPTTKTWPAAAARVETAATAIYTRGPQSVESTGPSPAAATSGAAGSPAPGAGGPGGSPTAASGADGAADDGFAPEVLVGDWPRDVLPRVPRARLTTWLAKPYASDPASVAISVPAGLETALPRLLLATRAREVRVTVASPLRDLPADLLSPVYRLTAEGTGLRAVRVPPPAPETGNAPDTGRAGDAERPGDNERTGDTERTGDAERILRRILDNAHGKLANTWREALIGARGDLTKKQARAVIAVVAPWAADVTVLELPAHRLRELPAAVRESLSSPAAAGSPG
ncbi:bis-aminopropyl spermidine synthase family protein [Streptosporangium sp. NPDC023615]|uniref:bis-aminopropyl spermidine synthase family protein n=1 Tax=Streptosporangium sp. NPDC023615 TaxID=3154794 RepID=UPI003421628C